MPRTIVSQLSPGRIAILAATGGEPRLQVEATQVDDLSTSGPASSASRSSSRPRRWPPRRSAGSGSPGQPRPPPRPAAGRWPPSRRRLPGCVAGQLSKTDPGEGLQQAEQGSSVSSTLTMRFGSLTRRMNVNQLRRCRSLLACLTRHAQRGGPSRTNDRADANAIHGVVERLGFDDLVNAVIDGERTADPRTAPRTPESRCRFWYAAVAERVLLGLPPGCARARPTSRCT